MSNINVIVRRIPLPNNNLFNTNEEWFNHIIHRCSQDGDIYEILLEEVIASATPEPVSRENALYEGVFIPIEGIEKAHVLPKNYIRFEVDEKRAVRNSIESRPANAYEVKENNAAFSQCMQVLQEYIFNVYNPQIQTSHGETRPARVSILKLTTYMFTQYMQSFFQSAMMSIRRVDSPPPYVYIIKVGYYTREIDEKGDYEIDMHAPTSYGSLSHGAWDITRNATTGGRVVKYRKPEGVQPFSHGITSESAYAKKFQDSFFMGASDENATSSDEDMGVYLIEVDYLPAPAGGCRVGCKPIHESIGSLHVINPNSSNNNCFFKCFGKEELSLLLEPPITQRSAFNEARQAVGLPPNSEIPVTHIFGICDHLEIKKPSIINAEEQLILESENPDFVFLLKDNHYTRLISQTTRCEKCGRSYINIANHTKQACERVVNQSESYGRRREANGERLIQHVVVCEKCNEYHSIHVGCKAEKELNPEDIKRKIMHYDLETYTSRDMHSGLEYEVSVVGYVYYDTEGIRVSGYKTSIGEFLNLLRMKKTSHIRVLNAFNGKNFDHYFIAKEFAKKGKLKDLNLLMKSGGIIGGSIYGKKFWDIARFCVGSLDANLKELGCKVQKKEIDYSMIRPFSEMNEEFKEKLIDYLDADMKGMVELTEVKVDYYAKKYNMDITEYISTAHLSYSTWLGKYIPENTPIYAPNEEFQEIISSAVIGGKVLNYQIQHESKSFVSSLTTEQHAEWKDSESKASIHIDIGDASVYDNESDYLVDLDGVSLYPSAMCLYEYPTGSPTHTTQYHAEEYLGIYEITWKAPRKMPFPIIPNRNPELDWRAVEGKGWYTCIDIEEAKKYNYQVEIHRGIVWPGKTKVFSKYINELFAIKKASKKGTIENAEAKMGMNSLYGKTIQRPVYEETTIVSSIDEIWDCILNRNHRILDIIEFPCETIIKSEPTDKMERNSRGNKPTQLGAFVLSYSRRIMNDNYYRIAGTSGNFLAMSEPFYGDTDSLILHASAITQDVKDNVIGKDLGKFDYDLSCPDGRPAKIVKYVGVEPKQYYCDYLVVAKNANGEMRTYLKRHIRCKGVPKRALDLNLLNARTIQALIPSAESKNQTIPSHPNVIVMKREAYKTHTSTVSTVVPFSIYLQNPSKILKSRDENGQVRRNEIT